MAKTDKMIRANSAGEKEMGILKKIPMKHLRDYGFLSPKGPYLKGLQNN